jgi:membrane protease YdiL (CAAX protease family)
MNEPRDEAAALERYRHPFIFYGLSLALPWAFWFAAAALSGRPDGASRLLASALGLAGLVSPVAVVIGLALRDRVLAADILARLRPFSKARPAYAAAAFLLLPASILLAMALSLLLGRPASQFLIKESSFQAGVYPAWFILILAPLLEELAWHTYGTDCLRRRMGLFPASVLFALYWALWHLPLGFIKGYYHAEVAESGILYTLNFAVSIFPFTLLMNWLYFRTGRNIAVAFVFHVMANIANEFFQTHPDSKVIQTGLLLIGSAIVIWKERGLFFGKPELPPRLAG